MLEQGLYHALGDVRVERGKYLTQRSLLFARTRAFPDFTASIHPNDHE
jgi:hypothetical protein